MAMAVCMICLLAWDLTQSLKQMLLLDVPIPFNGNEFLHQLIFLPPCPITKQNKTKQKRPNYIKLIWIMFKMIVCANFRYNNYIEIDESILFILLIHTHYRYHDELDTKSQKSTYSIEGTLEEIKKCANIKAIEILPSHNPLPIQGKAISSLGTMGMK